MDLNVHTWICELLGNQTGHVVSYVRDVESLLSRLMGDRAVKYEERSGHPW